MDVFLRPLAAPFASRSAAGIEINDLKNFWEKKLTQRNTKEAHTATEHGKVLRGRQNTELLYTPATRNLDP